MEDTGDLPVSDRSPGEALYSGRLGVCQKCSTSKRPVPKMTIDGVKVCPNCDTKPTTKSGLVNTIKDPGDEAFTKVVHKGKDGKEYIEMVPKSSAVFKKAVKDGGLPPPTRIDVNLNPSFMTQPVEQGVIAAPATELLSRLIKSVEVANVKTMPEFKSRDKIIKTLKKLQGQVDGLTGGSSRE